MPASNTIPSTSVSAPTIAVIVVRASVRIAVVVAAITSLISALSHMLKS